MLEWLGLRRLHNVIAESSLTWRWAQLVWLSWFQVFIQRCTPAHSMQHTFLHLANPTLGCAKDNHVVGVVEMPGAFRNPLRSISPSISSLFLMRQTCGLPTSLCHASLSLPYANNPKVKKKLAFWVLASRREKKRAESPQYYKIVEVSFPYHQNGS
jgi:hypothetical protein